MADELADRWGLPPFRRGERARVSEGVVGGIAVRLLKPMTFMNRSGAALAGLRADPAFDATRDLLVLVDDFAIPLGTHRLRREGSSGGHNGLKSIEGALQSSRYARLRIGVGPLPPGTTDWADFVLAAFTPEEERVFHEALPQFVAAADLWLHEEPTA